MRACSGHGTGTGPKFIMQSAEIDTAKFGVLHSFQGVFLTDTTWTIMRSHGIVYSLKNSL